MPTTSTTRTLPLLLTGALTDVAADSDPRQTTSADLWTQVCRTPYTHPTIPAEPPRKP